MGEQPMPVRRALLSVYDKTGLIEFARKLASMGVEILSTGGSARMLREAGVAVLEVADYTGAPEIMDGRVKTLHPKIHGGLLGRRDHERDASQMAEHGIGGIDLLAVNLYPFAETVASGAGYADCIENIDIGGPAMIRAGAKNHDRVAVAVDPGDYVCILEELEGGGTSLSTRKKLAAKAYARTAAYDAQISNWMAEVLDDPAPVWRAVSGSLKQTLRYGENPHQSAAFYATGDGRPGVATARQVQGKELSYNNINDTDAAFEAVAEFPPTDGPAAVIVKHANPCGVALGLSPVDAYRQALACDPVSAFGGIVALNTRIDKAAAEEIAKVFTEVVVAPDADEDALAVLAAKKNVRVLLTGGLPDPAAAGLTARTVAGGLLVQSRDGGTITAGDLKTVTKRAPAEAELRDLLFAFRVAKHVKSNAIVYAKDGATAGIGAGQMSRIDSARIAARKAVDAAEAAGWPDPRTKGSVVASDAFFPFADGLLAAVEAGATAVIQPGGSVRDEEVVAAADEAGLAMVFTGLRHFRH